MLRHRDARLIIGAVGISALGDFLIWVPLTLQLREMTNSGITVAALFLALWTPVVVLAPVAGLVVDRYESRAVLLVTSCVQAVIAAGLAFAVDSVPAVLVLATLLGIGFAFAQPAEFSLVPVIAGERLTDLNGWVESARYIGMTAGPGLGGILMSFGGAKAAMLVNAGTFVALVVAAVAMRARRPPARVAEDGQPDRARDGVVYLFRDRVLALVVSIVFVSLLVMTASATAEVFFLKGSLHVSDLVYGLMFMTWTGGMVAGASFVARRVPATAFALGVLVFVLIQGAGLGLPTALLSVGFAGAMWFIGGVGHGTKNVLARALIQQRVPNRLHGRAFAAYNGLRNGAELFALAGGGLLVAAIGGRGTLALAGGIPVVTSFVGILLYLRLAARETIPPAAAKVGAVDA